MTHRHCACCLDPLVRREATLHVPMQSRCETRGEDHGHMQQGRSDRDEHPQEQCCT